jgi:hypothetical protein
MTEILTITRDAQTNPNHDRAVRATDVAGLFASIITNRKITATLAKGGQAPAWSNSSGIWFNESQIADNLHLPEGVLSVKGLTCHELAHILFTPRSGSKVARFARENGDHRAFNILEDARIERLLAGRYNNVVVPWLTATIAQHILADANTLDTAFVLTHGRKYLPLDVRRAVRQAFVAQHLVADFARVIDEYNTLVFPRNNDRGIELIHEFSRLLRQLPADAPIDGGCASNPTEYSGGEDERAESAPSQDRDQQSADSRPDDEDDLTNDSAPQADEAEDEDEGDDADGDGEGDDVEGDETGEDDGFGDEDGDEPGNPGFGQGAGQPSNTPSDTETDSDADGDGDGSGDADSDASDGSGAGTSSATDDSIRKALEDILSNIEETHAKDIARTIADFNGESTDESLTDSGTDLPVAVTGESDVAPITRVVADDFAEELREIQSASDPGWEYERPTGRINASRYLRGCDLDEAFDQWNPGNDNAVDIECVVAIDVSGSMGGEPIALASQAMWGIKTALDSIGASTTVVTFGSRSEVLYSATEEAGHRVRAMDAGGWTHASEALRFANDTFARSSRAVKILFTITDGAWGDEDTADALVGDIREAGVLTALGYVHTSMYDAPATSEVDAHNSEVVASLSKASDLLVLGRQLVGLAIERGLVRG